MSEGARARAASARILGQLLVGKGSLTSLLADQNSQGADGALIQEICYGVCRYSPALRHLADRFLERPLRTKDQDIYGLLLAGAYQLFCLRVPDHAAVNETVQAASLLKKPWARGLINGVLRKLVAARGEWDTLLTAGPEEARYLHPAWLIDQLRADWPQQWQAVLDAGNQRPPMTLRVNQRRTTREAYLATLIEAGIGAHPGSLAATALYLEQPCPVEQLPGFFDGLVSVQDEASQLVAGLLALEPGQDVLDACAAPGGKTALCLESEQSLSSLTALDIDERRARSIPDNLARLGLAATATVIVADAAQPATWWDGRPFQRILLDAPCSATGVIRRHPDIKLLRTPAEVEQLTRRQHQLLDSLWPCLAPGGLLLYTTCSILKRENTNIIADFLGRQPDAKHQAIEADWGVECGHGRQLLPQTGGADGFYYALLQKDRLNDQRGSVSMVSAVEPAGPI